jgi:DNA-binding LacI/PurR family transcriptional regulator
MSSMKEVANLAGVSISTVSRVINENIPVDESTKKRVLDAIDQLNYKPNLLAKGLRVKSGNLIGFIVPEISLHPFVNLINSIEEYVVSKEFNLIIANTKNDPNVEEMQIDRLIRRNVDGVVITRVSDESRVIDIIDRSNIPFVVVDRELEMQESLSVVLDNYKAGRLAARHLLELGHREFACITGPLKIKLCRERLKGFENTLAENDIEFSKERIFEGNFKFNSGIKGMEHFLMHHVPITALWAQNDLMAVGCLKALHHKGIRVPEDISLMGMDDLEIARMITPTLTTIKQPFKQMSKDAVDMLLRKKSGQEVKPTKIVLQPQLIKRGSTSRCPR